MDVIVINPEITWFVQKQDYGRQVVIMPAQVLMSDEWRLMTYVPTEQKIMGKNVITGNEPLGCFFSPEEAQDLMDAMWEAGMRPTRR
jgi:hypothetical protein